MLVLSRHLSLRVSVSWRFCASLRDAIGPNTHLIKVAVTGQLPRDSPEGRLGLRKRRSILPRG